jgi:hypothetical protein
VSQTNEAASRTSPKSIIRSAFQSKREGTQLPLAEARADNIDNVFHKFKVVIAPTSD